MKKFLLLLPLILLFATTAGQAQQMSQDESRSTLRELKDIRVIIDPIGAEADKAGLDKNVLQTDIELKMRTAGLPVLSEDKAFDTPMGCYLNVRVTLVKGRFWTYSYSISLQLAQPAKLSSGKTTFATTWQKGEIGNIASRNIVNLRANVNDLTNMFVNDFLAVNPR